MRLAHKRKVQNKLKKWVKTGATTAPKVVVKTAPKNEKVEPEQQPVSTPVAPASEIKLTAKQQQVFDIVRANPEGINPKGIGLEAGQEDAKAASWATGALKKLVEQELVVRNQQAGNKVIYTTK
ncbi:MarR family transcriptional regulator [Vibrio ulleungensis]|uniref:MarR family transcriptional regulator n=1 Tax=Vibrio ulleungensis TaxID=2807619 RepID=A0ABS2HIL1_9VIBR|nr:MarR family transcriptional regulator [Vibrio ulleungensis]MBM7035909.1 MarR family transcriptional regulator [Vibrio ulleungensis]